MSVSEPKHMAAVTPSRINSRLVLLVMVLSIAMCATIAVLDVRSAGMSLSAALSDGAGKWQWLSVLNIVIIQCAVAAMLGVGFFELCGNVFRARATARMAVVLIIAMALFCVVLNGFVWMLGFYVFQLICVVTYQIMNDPNLMGRVPWTGLPVPKRLSVAFGVLRFWDREGTHLRREVTSDEVLYRKSYMPLNAFNIVWLFFVGCVVGLLLETVWHLAFYHEWQDRAGLVWGPLSPIYGTGAVCLTVVLNRFWRANPVLVFLVSGISGSVVEYFTSLYLEAAVGVVAWDYTGTVGSIGGRTNLFFFLCWGVLGLLWVKVFLPCTMRLVDMIPFNVRAVTTSILFAFLLVDFSVTIVACDCWSKRHAGMMPSTDAEVFFAQHFDDDWMSSRFQTMTFGDEAVHVQIEDESGIRFI